LATYFGTSFLPEVVAALSKHLVYHTLGICEWAKLRNPTIGKRASPNAVNMAQRVDPCFTPLLVYGKGFARVVEVFKAVSIYESPDGNSPKYYEFQKPVEEAMHFIRALTKPGDLVVDPFLGSGATAIACAELGRRFIGCDIKAECLNIYKHRAKEWQETKAVNRAV
jgi:DNA modification methylase